jgi:protein TonB
MFATLPASTHAEHPGGRLTALSTLTHALLIGGAVALTGSVSTPPSSPRTESPLPIYLPSSRPPAASAPQPSPAATTSRLVSPGPPLPLPDHVPLGLPPVDLTERPLRGYGEGRAGGASHEVPGDPADHRAPDQAWLPFEVDDPIEVLRQEPPTYPPVLKAAGITGVVEVQYVVDTLGRVEPASITANSATRPPFLDAVRHSLGAARFRPARVRGHPVRQLVQQRFRFDRDR